MGLTSVYERGFLTHNLIGLKLYKYYRINNTILAASESTYKIHSIYETTQ